MAELIRVNTRISKTLNEWLDNRSKETGLAKSTIVMLALEDYRKEKDAMEMLNNVTTMEMLMKEIDDIKKQLPSGK